MQLTTTNQPTTTLNKRDLITVVDQEISYFHNISSFHRNNIIIKTSSLLENTDFDSLLEGQDIVYHLVSTTMPINYLDISWYESVYGMLNPLPLSEGILLTAEFMQKNM